TAYLAVAEQYNISLARLFEFNDLASSEIVDKDQLIYLQRKRKTGNNEFHLMQPGETLHDIAQQEAIRLETLLEYNFLRGNETPAAGEQLYLKTKAPSAPRLALKENYMAYPNPAATTVASNTYAMNTRSHGGNAIIYVVQPKETIYSISRRY